MKTLLNHFLLRLLFFFAALHPAIPRLTRGWWLWWAWHMSAHIRNQTRRNGPKILGSYTDEELDAYGKGMLGAFYDSVCDVAAAGRKTPAQLAGQIARHNGEAHWRLARAPKKGVVVVTAHFGSFEVGLAAITSHEKNVHVLFHRDDAGLFERLRHNLHLRLGVKEAHVETQLGAWVQLHGALLQDGVVVLQGDRCLPRQKGRVRPFLHGHLEMPEGPAKLAMISGAPILPVVSFRNADGSVRVEMGAPIWVREEVPDRRAESDRALDLLAGFFGQAVRTDPAQWHVLHDAFTSPAL